MSKRYLKETDRLIKIIEAFRDLDPDGQLPLQSVQTFLIVMRNPGCSQQLVTEQTGLSQSSVSRNIQVLSEWAKVGKRGLNLIEPVVDPEDTRKRRLFLTREGVKIAAKVLGLVVGDEVSDYESPAGRGYVSSVRRAAMS